MKVEIPGTHLGWRNSVVRRALFQVHLWLGVALGIYLCVMSLSGAALLFRIELQRAEFPHLLEPSSPTAIVDAADIVGNLRIAYVRGDVVGVDAPTTARPVYLGYVSDHEGFHTVLADPATGNVLGKLPDRSAIGTLQNLHHNLLSGPTGELVNGFGALCLLLQILFSPQRPTPAFTTDLTTVFLDQYSGKILPPPAHQRSIGDRILQWVGPLHVGNFGGWPIRTLWLIVGLAPTVLFITGFLTWWRRVARPAYVQSSAAGARI